MFKRVDRRLKRKAEQEELGIDSELKEALGIPDTDSDESDSDSDPDSDSDVEEAGILEDEDEVEMDFDAEEGGLDADEGEDAEDEDAEDGQEEDDEEEVDDDIDMTIAQALKNPLYPSPSNENITRCFICPGRMLKNVPQFDLHLKSNHHTRRFSQFSKSCKDAQAGEDEDARPHIPQKTVKKELPTGVMSNREKKKLARREFQAKKRKDKQEAFHARQAKRTTEGKDTPKKAIADAKPSTTPTSSASKKPRPKRKPKPTSTSTNKPDSRSSKAPPKKKRKTEKSKP